MEEVWKDIEGYEGLYMVSNYCRIQSLERSWIAGNRGSKHYHKNKILSPSCNKYGYLQVVLYKDKKHKCYRVHRLGAKAFLPNPQNFEVVNHKDENPKNNFIWVNENGSVNPKKSNLEWCSQGYNINYGTRNEKAGNKIKEAKTNGKTSKAVIQYSLNGDFIKEWPSVNEIKRQTGFRNISECCLGKRKTAYKYIWRYKE